MVVDDSPDARDVLRQIIEARGNSVIEARDGQEGLELAHKHKPDAIISDGLMPVMDGFQFLRAVKQDEILRAVPFVFYTAIYTGDKDLELAFSLGADALIVKPVDPETFWKEFSSAIEKRSRKKTPDAPGDMIERNEDYLSNYCNVVAASLETKVHDLENVIAEHNRTSAALAESEERYRLLFESNPHPLWVFDLETLAFLAVNDAAIVKYGYSREEFLSMTIKDIRPPEDVPVLLEKVSRSREGFDEAGTWRHRKKGGTIIDVEITSHTLTFAGKKATLVMAIDVTEQRRLDLLIKNAANEWRDTFDAINEPIALLDNSGTLLRCNKALAKLAHKELHEILGKHYWEIIHGTAGPVADYPLERTKKTGKRETLVAPVKDRWYEVTADPFFDDRGTIMGAVHIMVDVTERKRSEEALRSSEEMHRLIFQGSPVGIFHYDTGLHITDCNDQFIEILKTKREKLIGLDMRTLRDQRVLPSLETPLAGKEDRYEGGYQATTHSAEIWISMRTAPFFDQHGAVKGGIGIVEDITERKKAEDAVEHQKHFTENLIRNSAIATFVLDAEHKVLIWNKACEELTGVPASEMIGTDLPWKPFYRQQRPVLADIVLSDDREKLVQLYPQFSKSVLMPDGLHAEAWLPALNGRDRYVVFDASPIRDSSGKIIAAIETLQDFTSRKKLEDEIIQAKQEWEETFNTITDMVTVHDKDYNIVRANKAAEKILGLSFLEPGKTKCFEYYHGTGCPPEGCPSCQSLETGLPSTSELFEPHLNMFIEIRAIPRFDSDGKIAGLIHVVRDISERKNAEKILLEERNKAQKYLDIAGVLIVALDAEGRVALINKRGLEIIGYEEQEMIGRSWFDLCIPERIREEVRGVFHELMSGNIVLGEYYENSIVTKNGFERVLAFHNAMLRGESGEMYGVLSSGEDITERKRAQDALNERVHHAALGAEIGVALTTGGDLRAVLQQCAEAVVRHLDAAFARIWTLSEKEQVLEMQASAGMYTHINGPHGRVPVGKFKIGMIAEERRPHMTNEVVGDPRVGDQEWARKEGLVAFAGYPLIVQDRLVGVMAMFSRNQLAETTMNSLGSVADIVALGIERKRTEASLARYSEELTALNTASNTLMVISNLTDIYAYICNIISDVFDLKMAWLGIVEPGTYEVRPVAYSGREDGYLSSIKIMWDDSLYGNGPTGMAIKTKKSFAANISDPAFAPWSEHARQRGYVASLAVPLIYARDKCIGALNFYSDDPGYFSSDRIKLCEIFANQAAIAIENARLVGGLEEKVEERTKAIEDTNAELLVVNRELELRRVEAEAASRSKTDFLANMSHELRTPLNAILGFSDIMLQGMAGPVSNKQKEFLNDIAASGNHLLALITDILDLSKIEAGKTELELGEFSAQELIASSLIMFKEKALKHSIRVETTVDEAITNITADHRKLKQVMVNLLSNAFKFTPDGGSVRVIARRVGSSEIGVRSMEQKQEGFNSEHRTPNSELPGNLIEISVTDTGIGISPENQKKLFQPFQQVETSLTRKYSGTGLGLSLCRRFVELHNGSIHVESEPGKGSTFIFTIPIRS